MITFLISLSIFALAFTAMAIGALRGRPPGPSGCEACPRRETQEGETPCPP